MNTRQSLVLDLKNIGIQQGDALFLRISYKAVGKTEGGPQTVIDAIMDCIGPEGTIIAAAFPQRQSFRYLSKKKIYKPGENLTTGIIPKLLSKMPGARFSTHPTSPFVCIGNLAKELTDNHTPMKHNFALIENAIELSSPKCLRIGGSVLVGTTHIAFSEGLKRNHQYHLRKPEGIYYQSDDGKWKFQYQEMSFFCKEGYENFCNSHIYTDPEALVGIGYVGQGEAFLTDMRKTLEIEKKLIIPDPQILLCNNPECLHCRSAYSYSEYSPMLFIFKLLGMKIQGNYTRGHFWRDIRNNIELSILGRKCQ